MIEQAIYFALGCVVTALCALGFLPILWSRALRLTRRRLQLQIPVSMQEILAERDQIRAQFAVERLRIEQEMEHVRATKGADMAEIGRRSVEMHALSEKHDALVLVAQAQERSIAQLDRVNAEAEAEAGALKKAINDAHVLLDQRSNELLGFVADNDVSSAAYEANDRAWMAREETLRGRLDTAMAQAMRHESSGLTLRREADEHKARVRFLEQELTRVNAALDQARLTVAPNASADSSLTPSAGSDRRDDKTDTELRSSIHALGLAVAVMARETREPPRKRPRMPRAVPQALRVEAE